MRKKHIKQETSVTRKEKNIVPHPNGATILTKTQMDPEKTSLSIEKSNKNGLSRTDWFVVYWIVAPIIAPFVAEGVKAFFGSMGSQMVKTHAELGNVQKLTRNAIEKNYPLEGSKWRAIFNNEAKNGFEEMARIKGGNRAIYIKSKVEEWLIQGGHFTEKELKKMKSIDNGKSSPADEWKRLKV